MKRRLKIISFCDITRNILVPWARAGHSCLSVDTGSPLEHRGLTIEHVRADVLTWHPRSGGWRQFDLFFASPPCTELAASGARWWVQKGAHKCFEAVHLVYRCRDICESFDKPYMLENPVGRLSTIWRSPDMICDPCDFGATYTKKTCLWIGGGFRLPVKQPAASRDTRYIHNMGPSVMRSFLRSVTPIELAEAIFIANESHLLDNRKVVSG